MSKRRRTPRQAPRQWRRSPHLSVAEAARVWGVSRSLAYEWWAGERFSTVQVGSARRVPRAEVERVLAAVERDRGPEPATLFGSGSGSGNGTGSFGDAWLAAVLADPRVDAEARALARWLASQADDDGRLSRGATAALSEALGGAQ